MNYESSIAREESGVAPPRRGRRGIVIGVVLLLVAIVGAALMFGRSGAETAGAPPAEAGASAPGGGVQQRVTVIVPGSEAVDRVIASTGTIAARREMPVGVAGEGGVVTRVLVEAGTWVAAGQVLATVDRAVQTQQSASLAAQIEVSRADARIAENELQRSRQLVDRGFISQADVDRKTATRDSAVARVRVAEAQLAENRARTGRLDIRAPAAGLVLTRDVEPGQVVGAGSGVLFRLARGGEMELRARLSEADLSGIAVGQPATVTPVGGNQGFDGQVWQLSPVIDATSRQGLVRIALGYDAALRPGGFASATIRSGAENAPLLPESAVMSDDQGNFVYVVGAGNKVERRGVTIGVVNDRGMTIASGLSGREPVVQSAGPFLTPGQVITPVRAAARG